MPIKFQKAKLISQEINGMLRPRTVCTSKPQLERQLEEINKIDHSFTIQGPDKEEIDMNNLKEIWNTKKAWILLRNVYTDSLSIWRIEDIDIAK